MPVRVLDEATSGEAVQAERTLTAAQIGSALLYVSGAMGNPDAATFAVEVDDQDEARARRVLAGLEAAVPPPDWSCRTCGEKSPATFDSCWSCGSLRR